MCPSCAWDMLCHCITPSCCQVAQQPHGQRLSLSLSMIDAMGVQVSPGSSPSHRRAMSPVGDPGGIRSTSPGTVMHTHAVYGTPHKVCRSDCSVLVCLCWPYAVCV